MFIVMGFFVALILCLFFFLSKYYTVGSVLCQDFLFYYFRIFWFYDLRFQSSFYLHNLNDGCGTEILLFPEERS